MVEALVANGDPDSAYDLIQEIRTEEDTGKSVVNAVIYGTVLKGFAHQKKFARVWSVYQEMLTIETDFTIVTFNTIIDACARCEELHRIPTLLKDMDRLMIQPNIITYGAILKGYCQEGNLDKAYELLKSMREATDFKPDEIMYNSLLDGCARQGLWERANAVLVEMEVAGIKPSNFTLSVLVKVGRRSTCKLDHIFTVCQDLGKKYSFRFNVHVYTNLVHACVDRKDWSKAMSVFADMLRERVRPDTRTYTVLLKGLVQAGERRAADGLLRAALGLPRANAELLAAVDNNTARLRLDSSLPKPLVAEIVDGIVSACTQSEEDLGASLLQDVKGLGFSVDAKVKLRFATRVANSYPRQPSRK
jgi:pentatricopeptide repeat protein